MQQLISSVVQSGGRDVDQHFQRYKSIVSLFRYSMLLDVHLQHAPQHHPPTPSSPCPLFLQLTKYQEQPQLLDGSLEGIVQPLAVLLRQTAVSSTAHDTALVQGVCRMLHVLISVRGYKTVVRFFPHEAADLERVLQVSWCLCVGCATPQASAATDVSCLLTFAPTNTAHCHHCVPLPAPCRSWAM